MTAADLNTDDSTIESIWKVTDPKLAEVLIDKLMSIAALRKMEIDNLRDNTSNRANAQATQQQQKQQQQPTQATPAAPTLNIASINAAIQALGNAP